MSQVQQTTFHELVAQLPDCYQPIYGHPELSMSVSRLCEDRLTHLISIHDAMRIKLNRPIRVLDLGCAQGFISLRLAEQGAKVHGVDFLDKNIFVCRGIAEQFPKLDVSFEVGSIEDVIGTLKPEQFDLVLGLSVFHHLVFRHGLTHVQNLITQLAHAIPSGVFEIALHHEPMNWGNAQPKNPQDVIKPFAFIHELDRMGTHLSTITRPLYFVSNIMWYLNGQLGCFDNWKSRSYSLIKGAHLGTRRYFFGENKFIKISQLNFSTQQRNANLREFQNEINFLASPPADYSAPKLILSGKNNAEAWFVREQLAGNLLAEMIEEKKILSC